MKGLALLLGKPKKSKGVDEDLLGDDEDNDSDDGMTEVAEGYAREMFAALRDEDEDAFVEAALALKRCNAGDE
jgi:hypothetical protein